jgi:hypothetical protein
MQRVSRVSRARRFRHARARVCDPSWVCGACVRARRLRIARAHSHSWKEKKNAESEILMRGARIIQILPDRYLERVMFKSRGDSYFQSTLNSC